MNGEWTKASQEALEQCVKINPSNPLNVARNIENAVHQLNALITACEYLVSEHPLMLTGLVAKSKEYLNDIKKET